MKTGFIYLLSLIFVSLGSIEAKEVDYHIDIAPILRDYCGGCHNESDYDGDFSIETYQALMEGGESGKAIVVPGDLKQSHLAELLFDKVKRPMPPRKEPQLSDAERELVKRWIMEGAKGPAPEKDLSILASLNVPTIQSAVTAPRPITAGEYSIDGKQIAIARFGRIEVGKKIIKLDGKINSLHFSKDGKRMITASGISGLKGIATVWDIDTGKALLSVGEGQHRDILFDAEFSPDGKLIATTGYDRKIILWESTTGKFIRSIEGHNGAIFDLAFSPDGSLLATASADETGKIWRVSDGERLATLGQPEGEQFRIAFTPDSNYIISTGADKKIRLWRLLSKKRAKINPLLHARFAHEEAITEMAMTADGQWLATASADDSIKIWSLPDLIQTKMIKNQPDLVSALSFGKSKSLLVGRMDGETTVYPLTDLERKPSDCTVYSGGMYTVQSAENTRAPVKVSESKETVTPVQTPAIISGTIDSPSDTDDFQFSAKKQQALTFEINAARSKSMLDSKIEILTTGGEQIERVVLQATRDSWFTFRGKDSNTSDDFRIHNWEEMELNEFLYANGEVVKLWHYPRGPDSGFRVYPGFGNRVGYFDTTALSHPLGAPCHVVVPYPPGTTPSPNGLPVFRLFWENDDDSQRMYGSDSRLTFVAPEDGQYIVRVSDVRGFGGKDYNYQLTIRPPAPDFSVSHNGAKLKVSPGSGREIEFKTKRIDRFQGGIHIALKNLPQGFYAQPVTIQADQLRAYMSVHAAIDAPAPSAAALKNIKVVATAMINGKSVEKTLASLPELGLAKPPAFRVEIFADAKQAARSVVGGDGILQLTIRAGETVSAMVKADRDKFKGRINFGKDESGRNMPHGVFVDNIGLNGLMIPEGKSEQRFWITAAKWVPETERLFHLTAQQDGKQSSQPVRLKVIK